MKQDDVAVEGPLPSISEAVDWWLKQWGRKDVLSGGEPMSREDVEQLICANGGTAAGLDLNFRNLHSANLSGMDLREASFQATDLGRADLRDADLFRADLRGAFLMQANIRSAYLLAVRIDDQTNLEDIDWGDKYINGWEQIKFY